MGFLAPNITLVGRLLTLWLIAQKVNLPDWCQYSYLEETSLKWIAEVLLEVPDKVMSDYRMWYGKVEYNLFVGFCVKLLL